MSPGTVFAGYLVERHLGSGGTSEVYLVSRTAPGARDETLKILDLDASHSVRTRRRFVAEAELLGRLHHPNIVAVHAHGEFDGRLWMSMHYVDGYSADHLVARGQIALDVRRAARIVSEVAEALDYAHSEGVLHRDVKPANILISTHPEASGREQVLLSDWGIARLLADESPLASPDGTVLASVGYAAPELLRGGPLTARTDVYALGATLVELLTGRTPFPLGTPLAIIHAHLTAPPPSVTDRRRSLPAALDGVIEVAMAKDPQERYSSCGSLAEAVATVLRENPVTVDGVVPGERRRVWRRRRRG